MPGDRRAVLNLAGPLPSHPRELPPHTARFPLQRAACGRPFPRHSGLDEPQTPETPVPSSLLTRRRLAIAGLAAAALGSLVADPGWAQSLGVDVWNVPALQQELRAGEDQERELIERNVEVRRRIAVKDAIIADLL